MAPQGEGIQIKMRLRLTPHVFRRLPRPTAISALELALIVLIAVQAARLVWTLVTPIGPLGDYRASGALTRAPTGSALGAFDPFFRLSGSPGPATVTALDLKLHGVREDRATGRGSAIIALPDGSQSSFAVGEEIMPGVTLSEVAFDSVTISRNGTAEQIFLDQSDPAPAASAPAPANASAAPAPPAAAPAPAPEGGPPLIFTPRSDGIAVGAGGDGGRAFRAAGFAPGDVIVSINGQRITSLDQARSQIGRSGGQANIIVNRAGRAVPLRVRLDP